MTTNTITARQYFQNVLNAHLSDEMDALSEKYIKGLDARNEKRKSTETKEKKETAERRAAVLAFLKEQTEPVTRDTIAGVLDMDPAKVSGACKGLVDAGLVTKSEVKVEKARKVAYSAVKWPKGGKLKNFPQKYNLDVQRLNINLDFFWNLW